MTLDKFSTVILEDNTEVFFIDGSNTHIGIFGFDSEEIQEELELCLEENYRDIHVYSEDISRATNDREDLLKSIENGLTLCISYGYKSEFYKLVDKYFIGVYCSFRPGTHSQLRVKLDRVTRIEARLLILAKLSDDCQAAYAYKAYGPSTCYFSRDGGTAGILAEELCEIILDDIFSRGNTICLSHGLNAYKETVFSELWNKVLVTTVSVQF